MKRKIKTKEGFIVEVDTDYVLKEGEEEASETPAAPETPETPETPEAPETPETPETPEDAKELKKFEDIVGKKIEDAVKGIIETPVKQSLISIQGNPTAEKSVMETDPYFRSKRPFVKLSKKMEGFVKNVRTTARGGVVKTMGEDDDTTGGFLVPEEFQAEVVRYTVENAIVRPRARVFTMARDQLTLPKLDQSSNRHGGATAYWAEESALKTASEPAFGRITLKVKKLIGLVPTSDELLADSAINLANYLVMIFGEVLAYEEDYRFLRGTGMRQPLGIINTSGINIVDRATSTRILVADIIGMYTAHPSYADPNAVWITTKAGIGQLMIIDRDSTNSVMMWMTNLKDAITPVLLGKQILLTDKLPALGTLGDLILGDLNQYYIGDRGGMKVDSSIHDRFRYDETTFRFVKRVDGQVAIPGAFTVLRA